MDTLNLRNEVEALIKQADDRLLKMVYALLLTYENREIVGFTTDGKPLTREEYDEELAEGERDIQQGDFINTRDLRSKITNMRIL